jgi:hypothetical protein
MDDACFLCKKKMKDGDDYTSINKGIYSEEGDKEWIALIFHDSCWEKIGVNASPELTPLFEAEV